ncbi:MAG TPA: TldD/PmbA family protein [bacterium (Candidatus Stahlbacteria)]|nr:TldD/PmbA family protein [Candidatus Stahlbacteria bacterium]
MIKDKIFEIGKKILNLSRGDQTEVIILRKGEGLTRFANSIIHQNVYQEDFRITVRVAVGKKLGVSSINSTGEDALKSVVQRAHEIAMHSQELPEFESFPSPTPAKMIDSFFESTAKTTPKERALIIKEAVRRATKHNFSVSGAFSTAETEFCVMNSLGISLYYPFTRAKFSIVVMSDDSQGYACATACDITKIDCIKVAEESIDKCARGRKPREIKPKAYDVILEPYAIAEILDWMAYIGMGGLSLLEEKSFLTGRLGKKIASEKITIYDDGLDPRGIPMPFDFEGVPKSKVMIIEKGVAKGVVYDTMTAKKAGTKTTGHAVPPEWAEVGPMPLNLFMETGNSSTEDMLSSLDRGIWVTKFHYVNGLLNTREALFTGMTRGGTFFVEGGKVKFPIKNLRFTESMIKAFANVTEVGKEAKLVPSDEQAIYLPSLLIRNFNFTGTTKY